MQALTEKGTELKAKFQKFQKLSVVIYALAAMAFVFFHNLPLLIVLVVLNIFLERKIYVCPHCGKTLDCRRKLTEDTCCPKCEKYLFRGL